MSEIKKIENLTNEEKEIISLYRSNSKFKKEIDKRIFISNHDDCGEAYSLYINNNKEKDRKVNQILKSLLEEKGPKYTKQWILNAILSYNENSKLTDIQKDTIKNYLGEILSELLEEIKNDKKEELDILEKYDMTEEELDEIMKNVHL